MEIISISSALSALKDAGVIQGAKSILDLRVDIKDVRPLMKGRTEAMLGSTKGWSVNIDGITIKFNGATSNAIGVAESYVVISLFEASIKDKEGNEQTIKYARFTAAE